MTGFLFIVLVVPITICHSQGLYPRPTFPDVFQTEIEATFRKEDKMVEIEASFFYDREKNRAALFIFKNNEWTRQAYNFDRDETMSIDGNVCDIDKIPAEQGFFPFTIVNGTKQLSSAEQAFFFTKSEAATPTLTDAFIPTLVYHANVGIPQYGQTDCSLTHVFTKPDFELATCKDGWLCKSTLISLSVQCKNEQGEIVVDHVYRFSRFKSNIEDESVFLPPPGIHCRMKNTKPMPPFPSYFSFTFGIIENPINIGQDSTLFNMHKEIWYDADYKILRIDEFDYDALHFSSRIFDLNAMIAFTMIGSQSTCTAGNITNDFRIEVTTRLPKVFFSKNDSAAAVFVGQRKVHGLNYQVWSLKWSDSETTTTVIEELYFLKIDSIKDMTFNEDGDESYLQISHADIYTYDMDGESEQNKLVLLKHFSVNNYQTTPREWSAFDVSSCFEKKQKKEFAIKIEKFPLVKGSQSYKEVLALFYQKIIEAAKVSILRISELRGIFDGVQLMKIRGSILDNSKSSGWPTSGTEPDMEETFKLIQKAATEGKLDVNFVGQNNKEKTIKVISFDALDDSPPDATKKSCYSGASMAAASFILFLIGLSFGIMGYYVFLKKKKLSNAPVRMQDLKS